MRKKIEQLPRKEIENLLLELKEVSPLNLVDLEMEDGWSLIGIPLLQAEMIGFLTMLDNPAVSYKIIGDDGHVIKSVTVDGVEGDEGNHYLELMVVSLEKYSELKEGND